MRFEVRFRGHPCVRSTHGSTVEITGSADLTPAGDCIVGVSASCGCAGLPGPLKKVLRDGSSRVRLKISAGPHEFSFEGRGSPALELSDPRDMVMRTSTHACPRTLAVACTRASDSVPRAMVAALQDPDARGALAIEAEPGAARPAQKI